MKRIIYLSIVLLTIFSVSSCATLFGKKLYPLSVNSTPESAEVYVNGERMGMTPLKLELKADKSYSIEFRKEGYKPVTRIVSSKVGTKWIILDILGGLVPVIVDAATGNWKELDQEIINGNLEKQ